VLDEPVDDRLHGVRRPERLAAAGVVI
jgi:hypothetical protein